MATEESQNETPKSQFSFFAVLEDTLYGVLEFLVRFFSVTLLCMFRPVRFVERFRSGDTPSQRGFPRPYTYLIICVFGFLKGMEAFSKARLDTARTPTGDYLGKVHEVMAQFSEITTVQIILSVFPTVVVILLLSAVVSLLLKPLKAPQYTQTSQLFSYIFGTQIVGALIVLLVLERMASMDDNEYGFILGAGLFLLGSLWLLMAATRALFEWFDLSLRNWYTKAGANGILALLVIGIAFSYFYTIAGAYSRLQPNKAARMPPAEADQVAAREVEDKFTVSVYRSALGDRTLTFWIFLNNQSDRTYFLHTKGTAMIMGFALDALDEMREEIKQRGELTEESTRKLLREYVERLSLGYFRLDVQLLDEGKSAVRLIEPGERKLVRYQGVLPLKAALGETPTGAISIPVARINADGSLSYTKVDQQIGTRHQDLYSNLEKKRSELNQDIDEQIKGLQQMFDGLWDDLDRHEEHEGESAEQEKPDNAEAGPTQ